MGSLARGMKRRKEREEAKAKAIEGMPSPDHIEVSSQLAFAVQNSVEGHDLRLITLALALCHIEADRDEPIDDLEWPDAPRRLAAWVQGVAQGYFKEGEDEPAPSTGANGPSAGESGSG
ncbi:MAG: hypothetical protein R3C97_19415 [Geminicoccaceae bacterium]